jgi:hypothetical protein
MAEKIHQGTNEFGNFLVNLARGFSGVEAEYADVLELYISLSYGDAQTPRAIPLAIAEAAGLFTQDVKALRPKLEVKLRWENLIKDMELADGRFLESLALPVAYQGKEGAGGEVQSVKATGDLGLEHWRKRKEENPLIAGKKGEAISDKDTGCEYSWSVYALSIDYALIGLCPKIEDLLKPYFYDCFERRKVEQYDWEKIKIPSSDFSWLKTSALPEEYFFDGLPQFLNECQKAAFVVFKILTAARTWYQWVKRTGKWAEPSRPEIAGRKRYEIIQVVNDIIQAVLAIQPVLAPRVPTASEIEILRSVCKEKLWEANYGSVAATFDEFARFCVLLAQPENHVKAKSA